MPLAARSSASWSPASHPTTGAAFLCAMLGITPDVREDHAAYLGHWLRILKGDERAIFTAAAHAQRAVDHLTGLQRPEEEAA